jgi:DNA modification methylase
LTASSSESRVVGRKTGPNPDQNRQHWPADAVERRAVASLVPGARNARTHSPQQVEQIAASIEAFGWTTPILVDEQSNLIAGHGRVLAAQRLGLVEIPTMVAKGWNEAQRRAYALADNRLPLSAGWNEDLLRIELTELKGLGVDLALTGFVSFELDTLFRRDSPGLTDPDAVPDLPVEPVTASGDVWRLGGHRLVCGDATDASVVERCLAGAKPGLMVTDPPYGVAYQPSWRADAGINRNTHKMGEIPNDDRADWRAAWALFHGDVAYVWHAGLFAGVVAEGLASAGFAIRSQIIWVKERFALSRGHYHWAHEPCWYAVRVGKSGRWAGDRSQSTRWDINARDDDGHGHGTQKPVECMRRPIENSSRQKEEVYEPFCGSGTTIIAAEMTGRRCLAIEIDLKYVDVSVERWQAFIGAKATLEETGETFEEVKARRLPPANPARESSRQEVAL